MFKKFIALTICAVLLSAAIAQADDAAEEGQDRAGARQKVKSIGQKLVHTLKEGAKSVASHIPVVGSHLSGKNGDATEAPAAEEAATEAAAEEAATTEAAAAAEGEEKKDEEAATEAAAEGEEATTEAAAEEATTEAAAEGEEATTEAAAEEEKKEE